MNDRNHDDARPASGYRAPSGAEYRPQREDAPRSGRGYEENAYRRNAAPQRQGEAAYRSQQRTYSSGRTEEAYRAGASAQRTPNGRSAGRYGTEAQRQRSAGGVNAGRYGAEIRTQRPAGGVNAGRYGTEAQTRRPAGGANTGRYGTEARTQRPADRRQSGARPSNRRPSGPTARRPVSARRDENVFLKVLKGVGMAVAGILSCIGRLLSGLNRCFDVFRRGEASTIIVNSVLGAGVIAALLTVFLLCKPGMDASRARTEALSGSVEEALKLVRALEEDDYPAEPLNEVRLIAIDRMIESGQYDSAEAVMDELPGGAQKQELGLRNQYARANSFYEAGKYGEAAQIFYQIDHYGDSAQRYADCRCALAIQAWQKGDEGSARSLLLDVPDVVTHVSNAALKIAGGEEGAQQILSAELFRADNLTRMSQTMQEINEARKDMPNGRIAAGRYHTVGLKSDGTLLATGDNSMNQLEVSGWSGIAQVAAGAYHTVGLREDGTVLAAGDNSQGQCNVSEWTDVIAVAASAYDTIGLKRDGTVVACGMNSGLTEGWHDVTFVTGGSYSMACLYDQGAMRATHGAAQMDMGVVLYDLSVCGPVSVGILYDGTMISSYEHAPDWVDMVSAAACETGILGIDSDGRVKTHFYRASDAVDISVSGEAAEVVSSGTHHVVLTADGRVYAYGNNDFGQCSVSDWQL